MTFKRIIGKIHLWLGLSSGLIVFIISITGCLFCFHDEIKDLTRPWRFVQVQDKPYVRPSLLQQYAAAVTDSGKAGYTVYVGKNRPATVYVTNKKSTYAVYMNPYTGKHIGTEDLKKDFFIIVEYIHLYLLLPAPVGSQIVGVSTLIFLVMLISGIVLWWPKKKNERKKSFRIKWNGRWRRVNYDLHNVLGFYAASIALILAITGLAIDYDWMRKAIYAGGNLGKTYPHEKKVPKVDTTQLAAPGAELTAMDRALIETMKRSPRAQMYGISPALKKSDPIFATAYPESLTFMHSDSYQYHPATAQLLIHLPNSQKSTGRKLADMNYSIHTGQVFGLAGKIIAFLASLVCASLPVTGFIIWWGRRKKKGRKKTVVKKAAEHIRKPHQPRRLTPGIPTN